jgi:hypothetical protein
MYCDRLSTPEGVEMIEKSCAECGEPITPARLEAQPTATLCVGCKSEVESQPKVTAHGKSEYLSAQHDRKATIQAKKNWKAILSDPSWHVQKE